MEEKFHRAVFNGKLEDIKKMISKSSINVIEKKKKK